MDQILQYLYNVSLNLCTFLYYFLLCFLIVAWSFLKFLQGLVEYSGGFFEFVILSLFGDENTFLSFLNVDSKSHSANLNNTQPVALNSTTTNNRCIHCKKSLEGHSGYSWGNGDTYCGKFQSFLFHDVNGLWTCHNGCKYEGEFIEGSFSGIGKYSDIDGTIHHGFWKDDFPFGDGVRYLPNGKRLMGTVQWLKEDRPTPNGSLRKLIQFDCHSNQEDSFQEIWYEGKRQSVESPILEKTSRNQSNEIRLVGLKNEILELQCDLEKALNSLNNTEKQLQKKTDKIKELEKEISAERLQAIEANTILVQKEKLLTRLVSLNQIHTEFAGGEDGLINQQKQLVTMSIQDIGRPRYALIFGNGEYQSPLNNPTNDATDLAARLESSCSFNVTVGLNLTYDEMREEIRKFKTMVNTPQNLKQGRIVVVYFSGHGGLDSDGKQFLCPNDKRGFLTKSTSQNLSFQSDLVDELNPTTTAHRTLTGLKGYQLIERNCNIFIVDACRSANSKDVTPVIPYSPGSYLVFSCQPKGVSFDGDEGKNGCYTACLLQALVKGNQLSFNEVFSQAKELTLGYVSKKKGATLPQIIDSTSGEFIFQYHPSFHKKVLNIQNQIFKKRS